MSISELRSSDKVLDPEEWVDAYGDILFRYAYRRLRDVHLAEEVVQETFLAAIRFQNHFAGRGSQIGWLTTILRRKILDQVRTRAGRSDRSTEDDVDYSTVLFDENGHWKQGILPSIGPDAQVEMGELWSIVEACLERLPQIQADVFVLSVMEEMDYQEICKELDISPSNLWVRLHRARLGLAKCVGAKWFER